MFKLMGFTDYVLNIYDTIEPVPAWNPNSPNFPGLNLPQEVHQVSNEEYEHDCR